MYTIEYGDYLVSYEVEGDVDGNQVIVTGITGDNISIDTEDMADIKFHCSSDFSERQTSHYLATGETL